ncbi:hypothetical protein B0T24DRAFT_487383, partial [Lasiosphaeria ovina]
STKAEVPFVPFLAGLTAWVLLRFGAEAIVRRVNPEFFEDLKLDIRRRYDLYFGTWLGLIFKAVSIVACTTALLTTSAETDIAGLARPLSTEEQWCWGCRAVLFVQELPHYVSIPELVVHHMLSIAAMIGILAWNFPRRQMYLIWATLLSEFANNSRRLLKMHGRLTPRLSVWLSAAIALNVVLFRVTGALVAIVWSLQGGTSSLALVLNVGAMSIYILYMLRMSVRELTRSELLIVRLGRPTKLIIAGNWEINLLGIFVGLGIVCTEVSALWIYEANVNHLTSKAEIHSIAWASLQAVIVGLFGAHATACLMRFSVVPAEAGQRSPRMCMQGGLVFAGAVILLSPTMESTVDRGTFLSCMSMSFLLLEAIGQIG